MDPTPAFENSELDPDLGRVTTEEENCLSKVHACLEARGSKKKERRAVDYDTQLLQLRDEIAAARMEDVPPLLEQMERLQGIAARQRQLGETETYIDPRSPYFGRMVLREAGREREILIGRATHLDTSSNLRIVDWRDAPVSRLYYRYAEGDDYDEVFGEREVEGEVVVRRSLTIVERRLRRVVSPQGVFIRPEKGEWRRGGSTIKLHGGAGTAIRAEQHHRPGKLGIGGGELSEDKHLKEITALIDARQFELITKSDSGLVVIQGGAGSGKTTIGLHRLAYLAYQDKKRFRPDQMLIVVFNNALARYIAQVLPALDVPGVPVRTYEDWSSRVRVGHFQYLTKNYADDTPTSVTRLKKHPVMLKALDEHVARLAQSFRQTLVAQAGDDEELKLAIGRRWDKTADRPLSHRVYALQRWATEEPTLVSTVVRHRLERHLQLALGRARDVIAAWSELLTDRVFLSQVFERHAPGAFSERDLDRICDWCGANSSRAIVEAEEREQKEREAQADKSEKKDKTDKRDKGESRHSSRGRSNDDSERHSEADDDNEGSAQGIDGGGLDEPAHLDHEDDTLLLRLHQRMRGPLLRPSMKEALVYEHVLVDEAQDLSPVELAVVLDTLSKAQSVTLAGDVAQRLYMNNGFSGWANVLGELGLSHVEIEPLKLSYRSTAPIMEFGRAVLGHLADPEPPEATRDGAPVELFRFADSGEAVGFLAEALRELIQTEPRASVALIARYPEQADIYYHGLKQAEVPYLRRIADQDFPFRPGIDVTDVRQVKGLEFDYVILAEVTESTYGEDDEARHLLHIAATRCSHQLWVVASGTPSKLLPQALQDRGY